MLEALARFISSSRLTSLRPKLLPLTLFSACLLLGWPFALQPLIATLRLLLPLHFPPYRLVTFSSFSS
jgi:hypothetical protein